MSTFFDAVVGMLARKGNDFLEFPTRRRGLRSNVALMARDGHLVVVHDIFRPQDPSAPCGQVQKEFEDHMEQVILKMIDYYGRGFRLRSVRLVMQSGGPLQLPDVFDFRGIEVITGAEVTDIRIDVPGIGTLTI